MARNIVVCFDGTSNEPNATANTNVVKVFQVLDLSDPTLQVAYYDPGVGTFSDPGAWTAPARRISRVMGLAFGSGLRQNLAEAYTYLMQVWEPDDRIYVFGFSRGAFNARALVGILQTIGLLRHGSENLVQYVVRAYARDHQEWSDADWDDTRVYANTFTHRVHGRYSVPVEYLGVWDTVKATGFLRGEVKWPYTRALPNVRRLRHAVSLDEERKPYHEYLVEPAHGWPERWEEAWFAGVHSDVGGTFADDARLSTIALKWVVDGARAAGLVVRDRGYTDACTVTEDFAGGAVHPAGGAWRLLGTRARPVPGGAHVHASVRPRAEADPAYAARLPSDVVWTDERWTEPFAPGPATPPPLPGEA